MTNLEAALLEAHQVVSDTAGLLHRARAARHHLEAASASAKGQEAERMVFATLLTALENGLRRSLEASLAELKTARREADSPADRWLRQQLEGLGE